MLKTLTKPHNGEGSTVQQTPPSMWEHMETTTTAIQGFTMNLKIDGAIVHMKRLPPNTITRNNLEELRTKMKKTKNKP